MTIEFASADLTMGQINSLVKKIMAQMKIKDPVEAIRRINSGEWTLVGPTQKWTEQDGVIRFSVTSDGTPGSQWSGLNKGGFKVSEYAEQLLKKITATDGITTNLTVLKGELFSDSDRTTANIRAEAKKRGLTEPDPETACLIREKFTDEELAAMGLWAIIAMHEPINDAGGDPCLLSASRGGDGPWLDTYYDGPGNRWFRGCGFAFAAQV